MDNIHHLWEEALTINNDPTLTDIEKHLANPVDEITIKQMACVNTEPDYYNSCMLQAYTIGALTIEVQKLIPKNIVSQYKVEDITFILNGESFSATKLIKNYVGSGTSINVNFSIYNTNGSNAGQQGMTPTTKLAEDSIHISFHNLNSLIDVLGLIHEISHAIVFQMTDYYLKEAKRLATESSSDDLNETIWQEYIDLMKVYSELLEQDPDGFIFLGGVWTEPAIQEVNDFKLKAELDAYAVNLELLKELRLMDTLFPDGQEQFAAFFTYALKERLPRNPEEAKKKKEQERKRAIRRNTGLVFGAEIKLEN